MHQNIIKIYYIEYTLDLAIFLFKKDPKYLTLFEELENLE